MQFASINSQIISAKDATVPISDRGLRFGDGVFETIALHNGVPYQWELHENRLREGLRALSITANTSSLRKDSLALAKKNGTKDGFIRIMVTRGDGSEGYLPAPSDVPRIIIENLPQGHKVTHAELIMSTYTRAPLSSMPTNHKLMQGLTSVLARMEAKSAGCLDGLILDSNGHVCETSSANIFWIKDGTVFTPPLSTGCIDGTTRAAVMRLSYLPVEEVSVTPDALKTAETVFLANSNWQLLPVSSIVPLNYTFPTDHVAFKIILEAYHNDIARYVAEYQNAVD